jgi:arylsulfatase A-like enzyme
VEGISLEPLLIDPNRKWKRAVFSQYPRARQSSRHKGHGEVMGYAVRTQRYRYVEWRQWESKIVLARELYDHETDPHEMHNIASQPLRRESVDELAKILSDGWKSALPDGSGDTE